MADTTTNDYATVLGPDATFKGELTFDGAAKILGKFEGEIASKGKVQIAKGSTCKATIEAKEIEVEGKVEGNINAGERFDLKPNGVIRGDIVATRMSMGEGASIDGHVRIGAAAAGGARNTSTTEVKPQAQAQQQQAATAKK